MIDLVWTGPETGGIANRDTGVVVRELFHSATRSVMIAGYAVYQGHLIFQALAQRMDEFPELRVRMFLDVRRSDGDSSGEAEIVRRFAARFRETVWPGTRMPELYYDPRSTDLDPSRRASLHAKCIVVDETQCFVSSANFTEAAQLRNIEVGLLVRSPALSHQLIQHFETLAAERLLKPVPLG
jgi:phosphatidylserine/phosphatidylglycerophosphate/cardiolipin synthase-like enzyme